MNFWRPCKTFDSVRSCMKNLKIAIANNSVRAMAMSKTHNKLTLFVVNLHFVRERIDFFMAKCENLEFFRGTRVLRYPTPCQMSFEHIVGRFWVGPAHLWDKCRLGRAGSLTPWGKLGPGLMIHLPFIAKPDNLFFAARLCNPNLICTSKTSLKRVELARDLL